MSIIPPVVRKKLQLGFLASRDDGKTTQAEHDGDLLLVFPDSASASLLHLESTHMLSASRTSLGPSPQGGEERKNNEQTRKKTCDIPWQSLLWLRAFYFLSLFFSPTLIFSPPCTPHPPSPEASTNRLPLCHRRVHVGPYGNPSYAQAEGEPYGARCAGVRGDAWTAMGLGSHLADGAGWRAGPGSARARSGQWWEVVHGGQSSVRCEQAAGEGC